MKTRIKTFSDDHTAKVVDENINTWLEEMENDKNNDFSILHSLKSESGLTFVYQTWPKPTPKTDK